MTLTWTDPESPNQSSFYDHVVAETPLGRIRIEWKSWKDHDTFCAQMPWGELVHGDDLDEAKSAVQTAWDRKVSEMAALATGPRP